MTDFEKKVLEWVKQPDGKEWVRIACLFCAGMDNNMHKGDMPKELEGVISDKDWQMFVEVRENMPGWIFEGIGGKGND